MPYLAYLLDDQLEGIVDVMLKRINKKRRALGADLYANVADPFCAQLQGVVLEKTFDDWEQLEKARQLQKTFEHQAGYLHQQILGSVAGWTQLGTGNVVDLVCEQKMVVAEVKNKHNTVKKSEHADLYAKLQALTGTSGRYRGYVSYYVEIVPETSAPYDVVFVPSDNSTGAKKPENPNIRRIDGYSFYHLVTGRPAALSELFEALPPVIAKLTGQPQSSSAKYRALFDAAYDPQR